MKVKDIIDLLALLRDYTEMLKFDFDGNKELIKKYEAQSKYELAEKYMREQVELGGKLQKILDITKMLMESKVL